ncbi:MAG TPA: tetratricopeptide repeat protein [Chitinophagaceae bacterium]|nr:tetratricopeptide repeat protein [Chitinophagaceae bacterium]
MTPIKTSLLLLFILIIQAQSSNAQSNPEKAHAKAKEAIRLEDEQGKFDEAIVLFNEARELDPGNIDYPYELAYAYSGKKDYRKASDILEELLDHKNVYGRVYQALGNAYDYQGKPEKALKAYETGIKKFPNSGELYLELGNMSLVKKDYGKALEQYERGIEADPRFPSNYYWASKIYCSSEEEVWGMIYGEIFMNLERNSKRTAEISKMLFETYKNEIKFTSDTSFGVSFSKGSTININNLNSKNIKMPFGTGVYEMILATAVIGEKIIDINSLDRIRTRFIESYFKGDNSTKYPNVLFDFLHQVKDAGHLEAYNHWITIKGDDEGFKTWYAENKSKWDNFIAWFGPNPLKVDMSHRFYRAQY